MKLSIIPEDNMVVLDGAAVEVDCSSINPNIHAVQWYNTFGVVEVKQGASQRIANLDKFQEVVTKAQEAIAPKPILPPTKGELKTASADKRWRMETGGITLNGFIIATDDRAKSLINGAFNLVNADPTLTQVDWVDGGVWVTLPAEAIRLISVAVGRHVQKMFTAQKTIGDLIDNGTITSYLEIETWDGWL